MQDRVVIVGLGYVGLTMAVCLTDIGVKTIGVDIDDRKIDLIRKGKSPIYEPHLEEMLRKAQNSGGLQVTKDLFSALEDSNIIFIAVGTPNNADGTTNLAQLKFTIRQLGETIGKIRKYHLIVIRSTIPPGTSENIIKPDLESISGKYCGRDFGLCVNPEFLSEGSAVQNMLNPYRIIIGEYNKESGEILENFYKKVKFNNLPRIIRTSMSNAELIKYVNNAFLATKISFINSIANLCEKIPRSDVEVIGKAIGLDPRISPLFLRAGLGWGGSCLPKDLEAIYNFSKKLGLDPLIFDSVIQINNLQPLRLVKKVKELLEDIKGKRIAILGLSFKPNTDDVRGAVSINIINELLKENVKICVYDPVAIKNTRKFFGKKIYYANSVKDCIKKTDCCIIVTEWNEFKKLKPCDFKTCMRRPLIMDGRRLYDPQDFSKELEYYTIGLGPFQGFLSL
jgi:UDPglucose 6-dehydrogenase